MIERDEALTLVAEAVQKGARAAVACRELGLDRRTVERWRRCNAGDQRHGPKTKPNHALSARTHEKILEIANSKEFRDVSPKVIVPRLADRNEYVASESRMKT